MSTTKKLCQAEEAEWASPWSENIKWAKKMLIDHVSYNKWIFDTFPVVKDFTPGEWGDPNMTMRPIGESKVFCLRTFPYLKQGRRHDGNPLAIFLSAEDNPIELRRSALKTYCGKNKVGSCAFTDDVYIPLLMENTGSEWDVWMALTPSEIISQRLGIMKARGTVLVGGMGMGWFARRVLEKPEVTHVTVCDIDEGVLEYFGRYLVEGFKDKVTLVHGDIYDQDAFAFDSYLSDIWPYINDMPDDEKFQEISEEHPNAWGWGYDIYASELFGIG